MGRGLYGSPELGRFRPKAGTLGEGGGADYPVRVEFIIPARNSRFLALPLLGFVVRHVVLFPHYMLLIALAVLVSLSQLFLWFPVLVGGRYPGWAYGMVGGYLRWNVRVQAYLFGLTDNYPPFTLG